jgi:hypothetical protein
METFAMLYTLEAKPGRNISSHQRRILSHTLPFNVKNFREAMVVLTACSPANCGAASRSLTSSKTFPESALGALELSKKLVNTTYLMVPSKTDRID